MLEYVSLSSGSKGNASYISDGRTSVLVDCGISFTELGRRAKACGVDLKSVNAVLVTHEHIDHIRGVASISGRLGVKAYAAEECRDEIARRCGNCAFGRMSEGGFTIGSMEIQPFRVPHDARYTVGYSIRTAGGAIGVATDLGAMNENILNHMAGSDIAVLEANHDVDMLKNGRYPYMLKARILSPHGHLSNADCAETIGALAERGVRNFVLAHLSMDNNTPELAFDTVKSALEDKNIRESVDVTVDVAPQFTPSRVIRIGK